MQHQLGRLCADPALRTHLAERGRATVIACHSCAHRVDRVFLDAELQQPLAIAIISGLIVQLPLVLLLLPHAASAVQASRVVVSAAKADVRPAVLK